MIVGIGTDCLGESRIRTILEGPGADVFMRGTFTPDEQLQARSRDDSISYFASRFCGKEAVFKALGTTDVRLNHIEILADDDGKPFVNLFETAWASAKAAGAKEAKVSLSHDAGVYIAMAVVQ